MQNHLNTQQTLAHLNQTFNFNQLIQYTGDLEVPYYYFALNNEFAQVRTFYGSMDIEGLFESIRNTYNVPKSHIWMHQSSNNNSEKVLFNGFMLQLKNDLLFSYNSQDGGMKIYYSDRIAAEEIQKLADLVNQFYLGEEYAQGKVFLMYEMNGYLYLRDFELKTAQIDIEKNYNDDFKKVNELIIKRLSTNEDKGLVLLHGTPGTGKTHYLRHLASVLNKKMIFIPPDFGELKFCLWCVHIVEDAVFD